MEGKTRNAVRHLIASALIVNVVLWGVDRARAFYLDTIVPANEAVLRQELRAMRRAIETSTLPTRSKHPARSTSGHGSRGSHTSGIPASEGRIGFGAR